MNQYLRDKSAPKTAFRSRILSFLLKKDNRIPLYVHMLCFYRALIDYKLLIINLLSQYIKVPGSIVPDLLNIYLLLSHVFYSGDIKGLAKEGGGIVKEFHGCEL